MASGDKHTRLRQARIAAGFRQGAEAIVRHDWNKNTYKANENGNAPYSFAQAKDYAKAYGVRAEWLYDGVGEMTSGSPRTVPLVGFVGAGAEAHYYEAAELGEVDAPDNATPSTVAAEIKGTSLGPLFDTWLIFWDEVRTPVTTDQIGRLCIVGLADGKVLVKRLRHATEGRYHLESNAEPTMYDQEVSWAARVKGMTPR